MNKPAIGQALPNFQFVATNNVSGQLSDFKGKAIILYFYPKDDTPGCTTEACDFNSDLNAFNQLDGVIFGVSRDTLASHEKFKKKFGLQFELIADTESQLCNLFGVINDKNMYGKILKGIERSTFIIDQNGKLVREWRKVKVPGHIVEVRQALEKLKN